jgi:hypothetical protein
MSLHSPTIINPFMIATMNPLAWCFNVTRLGHRAEGSTMGELATMSAPTTNTKRRTVHCSKHAFAPIASFRPKNAVVPSVTLPVQRHQSGLGRAGLASESPFTGDDPVNATDPLGLKTEGYCADVTVGIAGINVGGAFCLVEANGNQQVGYTFTIHGTIGFSSKIIAAAFNSGPFSLGEVFGGSASLVYQTSDANQICQLGGVFNTVGGSGSVGPVSASYQRYWGNGISGNDFGVGLAFGAGGVEAGAGLENTIVAETLSGSTATLAANIITGLNVANPLHWLAGPLGLY